MAHRVERNDTYSARRARQKPGAACNECRRRKLRCDGQLPQCGSCQSSGAQCEVSASHSPRGPKRGYLKSLLARISTLEAKQLQQEAATLVAGPATEPSIDINTYTFTEPIDPQLDFLLDDEDSYLLDTTSADKTTNSPAASPHASFSFKGASPPLVDVGHDESKTFDTPLGPRLGDEIITSLVQADLDQLYFDRIHSFVPILHHRCYFSWKNRAIKTGAQICLQHVMWVLAASTSANYQGVGDNLYQSIHQRLETLDSKETEAASTEIEYIQAWLLLAIHEFMRVDFRRGWISAGRALRLIQLSCLQIPYSPDNCLDQTNWLESEKRRRTLWLAHCLDRFISIQSGSPATIPEQTMTRLPAPESNFQHNQPAMMPLLCEVMTTYDGNDSSTFTECVIVATICGRALSHRYQSSIDGMSFNDKQDFWTRHQWIDASIVQRMGSFNLVYPSLAQEADPMLLFISMTWQAVIIHLYQTMDQVIPMIDEKRSVVTSYMPRALIAVQEIVSLAKNLSNHNGLKVHPLTLVPLSLCASFLTSYVNCGDAFSQQLQELKQVVTNLRAFNDFGRTFSVPP